MQLRFKPYTLIFKEDAGTSRGILKVKLTCFLKCWDENNPDLIGYGEAAWFPGLSPESEEEFYGELSALQNNFSSEKAAKYNGFSSIKFGLEQCLLDIGNGARGIYFPSKFTEGRSDLIINGLIWMGKKEVMLNRIEEKINSGFRCIKIKIGAINWNDELELIRIIRNEYGQHIEIRVDANGAFTPEECPKKLEQLATFNVHSIEQPIKAGMNEELRRICNDSPVPVALDESLIGNFSFEQKKDLISFIQPQYIILKPSLCGGFTGTLEWIRVAEELNKGWWITSALESSVGLDALAQFAAKQEVEMPQGLGTGALYVNNLPSPLSLQGERLRFTGQANCFRDILETIFNSNE